MDLDSYNSQQEMIEKVNHASVGRQHEDILRRKNKANQIEPKHKPKLQVRGYTFFNNIDQIKNKIMKMMVCTEERKAREQGQKAQCDFSLNPVQYQEELVEVRQTRHEALSQYVCNEQSQMFEDSVNDGTLMIDDSQTESEIDEDEQERQACLKSTQVTIQGFRSYLNWF